MDSGLDFGLDYGLDYGLDAKMPQGLGQKGGVPKRKRIRKEVCEPELVTACPSLTAVSSPEPELVTAHPSVTAVPSPATCSLSGGVLGESGSFSGSFNYNSPSFQYTSLQPPLFPHVPPETATPSGHICSPRCHPYPTPHLQRLLVLHRILTHFT